MTCSSDLLITYVETMFFVNRLLGGGSLFDFFYISVLKSIQKDEQMTEAIQITDLYYQLLI